MSNPQGIPESSNPWADGTSPTGQGMAPGPSTWTNPTFAGPGGHRHFGYSPTPTYSQPAPTAPYANPTFAPLPPAAEPTFTAASSPAPSSFENYAASPYAAGGMAVSPWQGAVPSAYPLGVLPEHPRAVIVLVLGLLGLVTSGLTCPFAWALGSAARREMRDNPGRWRPSGMLTAGWVLGIVGSVLWLMLIGLILLGIVLFAASS